MRLCPCLQPLLLKPEHVGAGIDLGASPLCLPLPPILLLPRLGAKTATRGLLWLPQDPACSLRKSKVQDAQGGQTEPPTLHR